MFLDSSVVELTSVSGTVTAFRWVIVGAIFAFLVYQERHRMEWMPFGQELAIVVSAYFLYFGVRGLTQGGVSAAADHAWDIVSFERRVGLLREADLQSLVVGHRWAVNVVNWIYIWGHWPVIVVTAIWLYLHNPAMYRRTRDAFILSGAIGLVCFAFYPVAPPRLIDAGLVDTVTLHSHAYRVLQPPALVNQYAAMPSLHFGWNLLIGFMIFRCTVHPVAKAFGAALPALMLSAVILTGNHFILDALVGGLLAMGALGVVAWLDRGRVARKTEPASASSAEPGEAVN